jgi:hypothetical protein
VFLKDGAQSLGVIAGVTYNQTHHFRLVKTIANTVPINMLPFGNPKDNLGPSEKAQRSLDRDAGRGM